jgi:regulator of replication initiation timing
MIFDNLDLNAIQDENARELILRLLNLIEKLTADLRDSQAENQRLRDEVNRLKGEQGKPKIKGNTPKSPPTNHSSENERHQTLSAA